MSARQVYAYQHINSSDVLGAACQLLLSMQAVRSTVPDELHMFDYGVECRTYFGLPRPCNQAVYGQETPPAYDFSTIKTPLVLFTGGHHAWCSLIVVCLMLCHTAGAVRTAGLHVPLSFGAPILVKGQAPVGHKPQMGYGRGCTLW